MLNNNRITVLREKIVKVTRVLTAEHNLQVTQAGSQAFVAYSQKTGKPERINIPFIPDNADQALINAVEGFIDHEVGHVLFSDVEVLAEACKDMKSRKGKLLASLNNMVEDVFVEAQMRKRFAGSDYNLTAMHNIFTTRIIDPEFQKRIVKPNATIMDAFDALICCAIRSWGGQRHFSDYMRDKWIHLGPIRAIIETKVDIINRLAVQKSSKESIEIARAILEALESSGDGDQQGDGKGKAKSGKGEKSEKSEKSEDESGESEGDGEGDEDESDGEEGDSSEKKESKPKKEKSEKKEKESKPKKEKSEKKKPKKDDGESEDESAGEESPEESEGESEPEPKPESKGGTGEDEDEGEEPESENEPAGGSSEDEGEEPESEDTPGAGDESDEDENDEDASGGGEEDEESDGADGAKKSAEEDGGDSKTGTEDAEPEPDREDEEGNAQSTPDMSHVIENDRELMDFDNAVMSIMAHDLGQAQKKAKYVPYTKEWDVIEQYNPPKRGNARTDELSDIVGTMTNSMTKSLERAFTAMNKSIWWNARKSGRMHDAALSKLIVNDPRIFRNKIENRTKDVAVSLVWDCSGSMSGQKMQTAGVAAWAMSEVLTRLKITHEIIGFTTGYARNGKSAALVEQADRERRASGNSYEFNERFSRMGPIYMPIFKRFNEPFGPEQRRRIASAIDDQGMMGANVDGESVQYAADRLMKQKEPGKIMIVLSDGEPAGPGDSTEFRQHLKETVKHLMKTGINVIGIGINTRSISEFYPKHVYLNNISDLPKTVVNQLRDAILVKQ